MGMSDRDLEDYRDYIQLPEIHTVQKEYSRRWWRSLLREQWSVLLLALLILFSLLLGVAFAIQDGNAPGIVLPTPVPLFP